MNFKPPDDYVEVSYNDFWSKWTGGGNCISNFDGDWKGFYCHKEDTFKKLYLSY